MSLVERVTALEQVIIQQNTHRLDRLEQSAIEADKRLTRLENLAERAENRLDRLEKAVADNTQAIDRLTSEFGNFKQDIAQQISQLEKNLSNQISSLGSRWGVQNESIWRQTIATLLEKSYGVTVQRLEIGGEEFDVIIRNGDHVIIEITSRFKMSDVNKVIQKRQLYTDQRQAPTRFIVAAASIHSKQVLQLIGFGFEVIEPDED